MQMIRERRGTQGFTLIEILVVIAIIGVLSTLAVISMMRARALGKEAAAQADMSTIRIAITLLLEDTGKWPNGCDPDGASNPEVNINDAQAGIVSQPTVGDQGDGCEWTAEDVAAWDGPYIVDTLNDAWGNAFWFDPDYTGYANCGSKATQNERAVVVSFGENGVGLNDYDCDDIFLAL